MQDIRKIYLAGLVLLICAGTGCSTLSAVGLQPLQGYCGGQNSITYVYDAGHCAGAFNN